MWLRDDVVAAVARVARVHYVDREATRMWNEHRREGELRLLTGWVWTERGGSGKYQQGLKTKTAAYRDAWYVLVQRSEAPPLGRRLRVVSRDDG